VTQHSNSCMGGWSPDLLLAYLEGDLPAETVRDLEAHLEGCPACSRTLTDLRHMDHLLKTSPEAFHPSSAQLWRFAIQGHDPDGLIAGHVEDCALCRQDADVLREMAAVGATLPEEPRAMPSSLRARLEALYPREPSPTFRVGWIQGALEQFRAAFRFPVLAAGTAAALVIAVVLSAPVWRGLVQIPILVEERPPGQVAPLPRFAEPQSKEEKVQRHEAPTRPQEAAQDKKADQAVTAKGQYVSPEKDSVSEAETREAKKSAEVSAGKSKERTSRRSSAEPLTERAPQRHLGGPPAPASKVAAPEKRAMQHVAPSTPGPVESARARPQSPIPVEVRIVDSRGEAVPWLNFAPPATATNRYRFFDRDKVGGTASTDGDLEAGAPQDAKIVPHGQDYPYPGYIVVVEVHAAGEGLYNVRATLLDRGVREIDSVAESGIGKEDLSRRVNAAVSTLLGIQ